MVEDLALLPYTQEGVAAIRPSISIVLGFLKLRIMLFPKMACYRFWGAKIWTLGLPKSSVLAFSWKVLSAHADAAMDLFGASAEDEMYS